MIHKAKAIHKLKWHLFYRIFSKKANRLVMHAVLQRLNLAIASQIRILKKLEKANAEKQLLNELKKVLGQEKKLLSKAKLTAIVSKEYMQTISLIEDEAISLLKKEEYLLSKLENKNFVKPKKPKMIKLSKKQAEQAAKIIFAINKTIKQAGNAVGNRKEVQKATKLLLKNLARLQHTEVYGFLREDAGNIRKAAKQMLQNPSETKLKHMLASLYLVAPFTFDATGAVVVLRYAAKYANKKSKGLQARIKAVNEKRKRHLRVFE
ncbi:MAG: hypothetical protein WC852_03800 [Candidatus Nanoarchaeia archaeon]|jgi:vacuolar-type H+-ATPase subunit I/STV1